MTLPRKELLLDIAKKFDTIRWVDLIDSGSLGVVILIFQLKYRSTTFNVEYSYVGNDYPEIWAIKSEQVLGAFDNSIRYHLVSSESDEEWLSLVPGDGIICQGHLVGQGRERTTPFITTILLVQADI
ncbi:hypothetical protein BU17DRAFT_68827 [Hysterangium stoloniferum]|nr:hypothetical protein BU17DRAFT_68827 [Hysterangium stoloniferum]